MKAASSLGALSRCRNGWAHPRAEQLEIEITQLLTIQRDGMDAPAKIDNFKAPVGHIRSKIEQDEPTKVQSATDMDDDEPEGEQLNALVEEEASKQLADAKATIEELRDKGAKHETESDDKHGELAEANAVILELRDTGAKQEADIDDKHSELAKASAVIEELRAKAVKHEPEIAHLVSKVAQQEAELDKGKESKAKETEVVGKLKASIAKQEVAQQEACTDYEARVAAYEKATEALKAEHVKGDGRW